jgi:hypothetical protein
VNCEWSFTDAAVERRTSILCAKMCVVAGGYRRLYVLVGDLESCVSFLCQLRGSSQSVASVSRGAK